MRVRKVSKFEKVEVPGTMQYGRILHSSSMEQYCYARLGYRINVQIHLINICACLQIGKFLDQTRIFEHEVEHEVEQLQATLKQ